MKLLQEVTAPAVSFVHIQYPCKHCGYSSELFSIDADGCVEVYCYSCKAYKTRIHPSKKED
jgi:lipopolysaccharide biosynthesis regulator YciM